MLPILYSYRRCPYAMRARMALKLANIEVEIREISLRDKPTHMLQISPKATVPVLIFPDGSIIDESLKIMFFLALSKLPSFVTASKKIAAHFTELSDFCINIIIPLQKNSVIHVFCCCCNI